MISKWTPRAKRVETWLVHLFYQVYPHLHWHHFTDLYFAMHPFHFLYCQRCKALYYRCPSCGHLSLSYTNIVVKGGTTEKRENDERQNEH